MQIKRDIANRRLAQRRQVTHFQNHFARLVFFVRETLVKRTPNHHGDDFVHRQSCQRFGSDPLTVAQYGNFIT